MRKILPILAMFFGLILILTGTGVFVIEPKLQNPGTISIPKEISNEPLFLQQSGWRVMDEFDRLHQRDFPLTAGSMGTYGSHQNVKLWVGETFWKIIAKRMIIDMRDEIATGSTVLALCDQLIANDIEEIAVTCTHGLFTHHSLERLQSYPQITEIVTSDTVPIPAEKRVPKLKILTVAPVFGEAIWRNSTQQSIGDLFTFGEGHEEETFPNNA